MSAMADDSSMIVGGVKIDIDRGLSGKYDADIVALAVGDAILGASNLGEIQELFPEDDQKYKDLSGIKLLEFVQVKLAKTNLVIENIDISLLCPQFDLIEYKTLIVLNISHALDLDPGRISIKNSALVCGLTAQNANVISALAVCSLFEFEDSADLNPVDQSEEEYYE